MPESKTSPRRIAAVERQRQALELRMANCTYDEIAKALKYANRSCAYYAIKTALKKTLQAPTDEHRSLNTERLNKILQVFWPSVLTKDERAAGIVLRAIAELRQLLGLDAPVQHEVGGPGGGPIPVEHGFRSELVDKMTDEEVMQAIAEAEAITQGR